jgi:hypothetical protein
MVQMQEVPQIYLGKARELPTYGLVVVPNLHHTCDFWDDIQLSSQDLYWGTYSHLSN